MIDANHELVLSLSDKIFAQFCVLLERIHGGYGTYRVDAKGFTDHITHVLQILVNFECKIILKIFCRVMRFICWSEFVEFGTRSFQALRICHKVRQSTLHRVLCRLSPSKNHVNHLIYKIVFSEDTGATEHEWEDVTTWFKTALNLTWDTLFDIISDHLAHNEAILITITFILCKCIAFPGHFIEQVP